MSHTKHCPQCNRTLPLTAFALRKRGSEARQSYCRSCINDTRRATYARQKEANHG